MDAATRAITAVTNFVAGSHSDPDFNAVFNLDVFGGGGNLAGDSTQPLRINPFVSSAVWKILPVGART